MIKIEEDNAASEGFVESDGKNLMDYSYFFTKFDENPQQNNLSDALAFIQSEVNSLKEKIRGIEENIVEMSKEIGDDKFI